MKHSALIFKILTLAIALSALLGLSRPHLAFAQDENTPTVTATEIFPYTNRNAICANRNTA